MSDEAPKVLSADGRPALDDACPGCGSAQHIETQTGFGGFWKRVCKKCVRVLAEGREQ